MNWSEYVRRVTRGQTQDQAADAIGTSGPTVSRWLAGQSPSAAQAIQVARAYRDSPLNALVAADFLTPEEAKQRPAAAPDPSGLTNDELLDLVRSRMSRPLAVVDDDYPLSKDDLEGIARQDIPDITPKPQTRRRPAAKRGVSEGKARRGEVAE